MYLQELTLTNYRNIAGANVVLGPGITIFVGPNGQGKTNLLEAIGYAATLQSHRVSSDSALVKSGRTEARISATFRTEGRRSVVDIALQATGSNRVELNSNPVKRRAIAGQFPLTLFSPRDLALVSGDPSDRRTFLNELSVQLRPAFSDQFANYERVLKQRNSLLKSARNRGVSGENLSTLGDWDEQLARFGAAILHRRRDTVDALRTYVAAAYHEIAGTEEVVDIGMETTVPVLATPDETTQVFRELLFAGRANEIDRGMTLVGPHRDELVLSLSTLVVKQHASHGESWSFALSLRLASARLVRESSRVGDPIVMLDDVFAELDKDRRSRLALLVSDFEQVLITAAVEEELPELAGGRRIRVRGGVVGGD